MPHRTLLDQSGTTWQVWATRPGPRSRVSPGLQQGWLTFETPGPSPQKRRITPIPPEWEDAAESQLLQWLQEARVVVGTRRTIPSVLEEAAAPPHPR